MIILIIEYPFGDIESKVFYAMKEAYDYMEKEKEWAINIAHITPKFKIIVIDDGLLKPQ